MLYRAHRHCGSLASNPASCQWKTQQRKRIANTAEVAELSQFISAHLDGDEAEACQNTKTSLRSRTKSSPSEKVNFKIYVY